MNHLTKETSERLTKAGVLDDVDIEHVYDNYGELGEFRYASDLMDDFACEGYIKAPNLEETLKLLPTGSILYYRGGANKNIAWDLNINDSCISHLLGNVDCYFEAETPILCIEEMLIYLLDNQLLGNKKG